MMTVTVRQLRNESADVLARVGAGESLTVTRDGDPVAAIGVCGIGQSLVAGGPIKGREASAD